MWVSTAANEPCSCWPGVARRRCRRELLHTRSVCAYLLVVPRACVCVRARSSWRPWTWTPSRTCRRQKSSRPSRPRDLRVSLGGGDWGQGGSSQGSNLLAGLRERAGCGSGQRLPCPSCGAVHARGVSCPATPTTVHPLLACLRLRCCCLHAAAARPQTTTRAPSTASSSAPARTTSCSAAGTSTCSAT